MEENDYKFKKEKYALASVAMYRKILKDNVISKLKFLIDSVYSDKSGLEDTIYKYNEFLYALLESGSNSLEQYVINKIIFDENPFSIKAQLENRFEKGFSIEKSAAEDLDNLQVIAKINSQIVKKELLKDYIHTEFETSVINKLPDWSACDEYSSENYPKYAAGLINKFYENEKWSECIEELKQFHKKYGCGIFAKYKAFVWGNHAFTGAVNADPITLQELIGYEAERLIIKDNTLQFLKGRSANNVLLYGDRGTGKSSTVKALLNEYFIDGLRLVEVSKADLFELPAIIKCIKDRPQKFIIFIDDLVFGEDDESYNALKAILEGGIESKPDNVLIYATSNRRHLVKEYFHERTADNGEIHANDGVQEKLSLADRFGITVVFSAPDKNKYLEIVDGIAANRNIKIDTEKLHSEALKWELWYNGRSPRTARQFVDWLEGQEDLIKK